MSDVTAVSRWLTLIVNVRRLVFAGVNGALNRERAPVRSPREIIALIVKDFSLGGQLFARRCSLRANGPGKEANSARESAVFCQR